MNGETKMDIETPSKAITLPWVEKYRPKGLSDLISHEYILKTLRTFMNANNLPNLLFYGPPGTGKTSTIVAVAREMYQKDYSNMVLELNASDERGINVVREAIKGFAGTGTLSNTRGIKLIILDEADMMTNPAQFALRRIIEKYHFNVRFCLISNYVSKIIPALQSRCTRFKFKQIPFEFAGPRMEAICQAENLNLGRSGIDAVFKLGAGDMRRVVNMLQSLSMADFTDAIEAQHIYSFTGNPSPQLLQEFMNMFMNEKIQRAFNVAYGELKARGIALQALLKNFYQMLLQINLPDRQKAFLVGRLGDIEYRLSIGCQDSLALASLIGAFVEIRHLGK